MAVAKKLSWIFPMKEFMFLKIETITVAVIALLTFLTIFAQSEQSWLSAALFTAAFVGFYYLLSYIIQKVRMVEEKYHLTPTHLEVTRKSRNKLSKSKIPLKEIARHKLTKFFMGGYLITKKGKKHLLFFNTKEEVMKFESFLKKHWKKKK
jgi:hypothetical protein